MLMDGRSDQYSLDAVAVLTGDLVRSLLCDASVDRMSLSSYVTLQHGQQLVRVVLLSNNLTNNEEDIGTSMLKPCIPWISEYTSSPLHGRVLMLF